MTCLDKVKITHPLQGTNINMLNFVHTANHNVLFICIFSNISVLFFVVVFLTYKCLLPSYKALLVIFLDVLQLCRATSYSFYQRGLLDPCGACRLPHGEVCLDVLQKSSVDLYFIHMSSATALCLANQARVDCSWLKNEKQ